MRAAKPADLVARKRQEKGNAFERAYRGVVNTLMLKDLQMGKRPTLRSVPGRSHVVTWKVCKLLKTKDGRQSPDRSSAVGVRERL
jgi:hypothetical protein